jgi:hypothetical protein
MTMNRCYEALTWAIKLMPTRKAQAALSTAYNEMPQSSEADEDRIVVFMASCVIDGLRHGRWIGHTSEECLAMAAKKEAAKIARGE